MKHAVDPVTLIGSPLKMSQTPVTYDRPTALGANTGAVLARDLGLTRVELAALAATGVIGGEVEP